MWNSTQLKNSSYDKNNYFWSPKAFNNADSRNMVYGTFSSADKNYNNYNGEDPYYYENYGYNNLKSPKDANNDMIYSNFLQSPVGQTFHPRSQDYYRRENALYMSSERNNFDWGYSAANGSVAFGRPEDNIRGMTNAPRGAVINDPKLRMLMNDVNDVIERATNTDKALTNILRTQPSHTSHRDQGVRFDKFNVASYNDLNVREYLRNLDNKLSKYTEKSTFGERSQTLSEEPRMKKIGMSETTLGKKSEENLKKDGKGRSCERREKSGDRKETQKESLKDKNRQIDKGKSHEGESDYKDKMREIRDSESRSKFEKNQKREEPKGILKKKKKTENSPRIRGETLDDKANNSNMEKSDPLKNPRRKTKKKYNEVNESKISSSEEDSAYSNKDAKRRKRKKSRKEKSRKRESRSLLNDDSLKIPLNEEELKNLIKKYNKKSFGSSETNLDKLNEKNLMIAQSVIPMVLLPEQEVLARVNSNTSNGLTGQVQPQQMNMAPEIPPKEKMVLKKEEGKNFDEGKLIDTRTSKQEAARGLNSIAPQPEIAKMKAGLKGGPEVNVDIVNLKDFEQNVNFEGGLKNKPISMEEKSSIVDKAFITSANQSNDSASVRKKEDPSKIITGPKKAVSNSEQNILNKNILNASISDSINSKKVLSMNNQNIKQAVVNCSMNIVIPSSVKNSNEITSVRSLGTGSPVSKLGPEKHQCFLKPKTLNEDERPNDISMESESTQREPFNEPVPTKKFLSQASQNATKNIKIQSPLKEISNNIRNNSQKKILVDDAFNSTKTVNLDQSVVKSGGCFCFWKSSDMNKGSKREKFPFKEIKASVVNTQVKTDMIFCIDCQKEIPIERADIHSLRCERKDKVYDCVKKSNTVPDLDSASIRSQRDDKDADHRGSEVGESNIKLRRLGESLETKLAECRNNEIDKLNKSRTGPILNYIRMIIGSIEQVLENDDDVKLLWIGLSDVELLRQRLKNLHTAKADEIHNMTRPTSDWIREKIAAISPSSHQDVTITSEGPSAFGKGISVGTSNYMLGINQSYNKLFIPMAGKIKKPAKRGEVATEESVANETRVDNNKSLSNESTIVNEDLGPTNFIEHAAKFKMGNSKPFNGKGGLFGLQNKPEPILSDIKRREDGYKKAIISSPNEDMIGMDEASYGNIIQKEHYRESIHSMMMIPTRGSNYDSLHKNFYYCGDKENLRGTDKSCPYEKLKPRDKNFEKKKKKFMDMAVRLKLNLQMNHPARGIAVQDLYTDEIICSLDEEKWPDFIAKEYERLRDVELSYNNGY